MPKRQKAENKLLNKSTGNTGESAAVQLLENKGYKILATNYRSSFAELDIVAIDGDTLVFVEVKTRRNTKYGMPYEAVNQRKLHKISRAGELFVKQNSGLPKKHRIDVVSLIMDGNEIMSSRLIKVT